MQLFTRRPRNRGSLLRRSIWKNSLGLSSRPRVAGKAHLRVGLEALEERRLLSVNPQLVSDINVGPDSSLYPNHAGFPAAGYLNTDGVVFFAAKDGIHGEELWVSDGTEEGTRLVKDIAPGPDDARLSHLAVLDGKVYFQAINDDYSSELWVSDGTENGTIRLTDINPGPGSSNPRQLRVFDNEIYFLANEVWHTDGTVAGTLPWGDPGATDRFGVNDELLFMSANWGPLWVSDGTLGGTTQVVDSNGLAPEFAQIYGEVPTNSAGEAFFTARTDEYGIELWKTDGTPAGTAMVKDIVAGPDDGVQFSVPDRVPVIMNDIAYFVASDGVAGSELWRTDGTETGTYMVKEVIAGNNLHGPTDLKAVGDKLFFSALSDSDTGIELWVTDGTEAGTVLVKDIWPGSGHGRPSELVAVGDILYFRAESPNEGAELWMSDGTEAGTVLLTDINPGSASSEGNNTFYGQKMAAFKNALFFAATNGVTGGEPWLINLSPNAAPVADAGGPYIVSSLSDPLVLDASASFDPDLDEALSYFWDLNGDGIYEDVAGKVVTLDPATLSTLGLSETNPVAQISVRVSDGIGGATNSLPVLVTLEGPPVTVIDGPVEAVTHEPLTYTFSAIVGDGGPYSYQIDWDGDSVFDESVASTAGSFDLIHTYTQAGNFDIGVVASDSSETGPLITYSVSVEAAVADIGGPYSGAQGALIAVSAADSTGSLYEWDLDNDGLYDDATGVNINFNATDDGAFPIGLRVNGPGGPTDSTTVYVATAVADIGGPYFANNGVPLTLSAAGSVGGLFEWDLDNDGQYDDATGTVANFDTSADGVFTIGLRVNGPGGLIDSTTVTVETTSADIGGPYFGDKGTLIALNAASSVGSLIEWDLDNDGLYDDAVGANVNFNATHNGTFDIAIRVNGPGGSTDSTQVTVSEPVIADAGGPYTTAVGSLITLHAKQGVGTLYEWDLDNDGQYDDATGLNATFDASSLGIFTVGLRVNGPSGPTDSTTVSVVSPTAVIGGPYTAYEGKSVFVSGSASIGATSYEWDLDNDGQFDDATGVNALFGPASAGVYTIGLRINGPGGSTDSTTISVIEAPSSYANLVRDINIEPGMTFAELNGQIYFGRESESHGTELWRSDGTVAGTELFLNLSDPGFFSSPPGHFVATDNRIFFLAPEEPFNPFGNNKAQLWTSDGTVAGTLQLTDIEVGGIGFGYPSRGPDLSDLTVVGDRVFFTAYTSSDGRELWSSDGTIAGTSMVVDLSPGSSTFPFPFPYGSSIPHSTNFGELVDVDGMLFFTAKNSQLFKSDGTAAGTEAVTFTPGVTMPQDLTAVGDTLFFTAFDTSGGRELWKSDGTTTGTMRVKDIRPGAESSQFGELTAVADLLYFQVDDGVHGAELWRSNGTEFGTMLVADLVPGVGSSHPHELTNLDGTLYFVANDKVNGEELWTTDGVAGGTSMVVDIRPGAGSSNPSQLTAVSGGLYFSANDGTNGEELWVSNGTALGTQLASDFLSGSAGTKPRNLVPFGSQVLFVGFNAAGTQELSISNGSAAGTFSLTPLPRDLPPSSIPRQFVDVDGITFFTANDGVHGEVLWRTDGTEEGTVLVKDINTREHQLYGYLIPEVSEILGVVGSKVLFQADDDTTNNQLWVSDGTETGTFRLTDGLSNQRYASEFNGELFFLNGNDVWRTDGTVAGTALFDIPFNVSRMAVNDDFLFFSESGGSLWLSDGTLAGTFQVVDPGGNMPSSSIHGIIPTNSSGEAFLVASSVGGGGLELWKTDGTIDGTGLVKDIYVGESSSTPSQLTLVNDILFFTANDGVNGNQLWRSDGTESGTQIVVDLAVLDRPDFPENLTAVGDLLFFTADSGSEEELWVSDGTSAGTTVVKEFGPEFGNLEELVAADGKLYFRPQAETVQIWESDGTESGTVMVSEFQPSELSAYLFSYGAFLNLTAVKGALFFTTDDGRSGLEPWLMNPSPNAAPIADAGGPYTVAVGDSLVLDASASYDPDLDEALSYFWDINGDGDYRDAVGKVVTLDWATLYKLGISETNSTVQVSVRVSDGIGGADNSAPVSLTVTAPLMASIGGPYTGDEGSLIALNGAFSSGATLYEWDLDNDGQYDDATGVSPNFNATDDGVYTIGLRINGPGGPTASTTVTVNNVAPTASISGTTAIYRGETVIFTLNASDASPVDQAGLFTFEIDWDGNGTVDQTIAGVPSGTTVMHMFPGLTANNIQVRATDKDASTGGFAQTPITVTPHVLRDDGFGNTDLIWGGTPLFDSVYVVGQAPSLLLYVEIEGLVPVKRIDHFGSAVTGRVIIYGYDFTDVLIGQAAMGNVVEIHGGAGNDVIVGGYLGDFLYGGPGDDLILGGTGAIDGADTIFGDEGRDTIFGHLGADTLDGGAGEDLLISDRMNFSNLPSAVQQIHEEWKSARPYSERVSNILGTTSTGVNGPWKLQPGVTILDDGAADSVTGGLGELDWFFYDFAQDMLGDTIEVGEEETDSSP